ncbi:M14 family zinc carboxypeptidase [Parapedobacter koreensis]|uniref:Zinc carboxypeptidase n=1 Tax=Parapedobacter koreensis TaxID=332977 RepID=A0A1H7LG79_9SPHI|nr:M14 family zinc carboxypeptidase [Parapedobacter koreensis]SEK97505.1 Zinc carboxypeptidase [Parapedobacter koreensis]
MKRFFLLFLICYGPGVAAQQTAFERDSNTTATYEEVVAFYQTLDRQYASCTLLTCGPTDSGRPLHLFVMAKDGQFDPQQIHQQDKTVILINNGIHPGEPEGIDAAMMLARDLLAQNKLPENAVLCIIPVYNIDGMLNRGTSRANQNGPESYGFRGNARNYDLNRDFIKTDSRNSHSFQEIFHTWQPDIFMDTHTSNGADYQYIMTLIDTQVDKLHPAVQHTASAFTAELYARMEKSGYGMVPYVSFRGRSPESGLVSFYESPRYSTGYASLHHTFGYMPETHMWKPYPQRVWSTYTLLNHFIVLADERAAEIHAQRKQAREQSKTQQQFVLTWQLDTTQYEHIAFKGYESGEKPSDVSGFPRQYYDRSKPFTKDIPYYNHYKAGLTVEKPYAYIIPQAWQNVVDLLTLNGIQVNQLEKDTILTLQLYYIEDYQTGRAPYEGHYLHSNVKLRVEVMPIQCYKGDYLIITDQPGNRYLVEALEPQAADSYFSWNFFDSILSQKEHFSAYIFEDEAYRMLNEDTELKRQFEAAKAADEHLRSDGRAQLEWIYKRSPYYEQTYLRYPIGRLLKR